MLGMWRSQPKSASHPLDADFVDKFHVEPELEPKLIALQKKDKQELLTIDKFKPFSIIRSNPHSGK